MATLSPISQNHGYLSKPHLKIMATLSPISQNHGYLSKPHLKIMATVSPISISIPNPNFSFYSRVLKRCVFGGMKRGGEVVLMKRGAIVSEMAATEREKEKPNKRYPGEGKGFVEEMRFVAMKLHTRDQSKEGEREPEDKPVAKWEPTIDGYLRFLVDSKLVYDTLERIVEKAAYPSYAEFRNTGLERSEKLVKDLEWFKEQGHTIPEPSTPGVTYANYLEELSVKDPQAFLCHFYNVYFAHSAGGRMIGKKVAEMLINKKELEFYKWDGELSQLLQNVRETLNRVAESWTREEKNHCLEETEKSFKYSGQILRLIMS